MKQFPLYLETNGGGSRYYFKSEDEGICVFNVGAFSNIQTCRLSVAIKIANECEQPLIESTQQRFADAMAEATSILDAIISSDLLETEITYPLNAVL